METSDNKQNKAEVSMGGQKNGAAGGSGYGSSDSAGTLPERLRAAALGDVDPSPGTMPALLVEAAEALAMSNGEGLHMDESPAVKLVRRLLWDLAPPGREPTDEAWAKVSTRDVKVLAAAVASLADLRRQQNEGLTAYERYMEIAREARADRCDQVDREDRELAEKRRAELVDRVEVAYFSNLSSASPFVTIERADLKALLAHASASLYPSAPAQAANELVDGLARFDARRRYRKIVDDLRVRRATAGWKPEDDRVFLIALDNLFGAMSPEDQKIANAEGWRSWPDLSNEQQRAQNTDDFAARVREGRVFQRGPDTFSLMTDEPQAAAPAPAKCQHDFHIVGTNSVCRFCDLLEHYFRLHEKEALESLPLRLRHAAAGTGGYGPSDLAALLEEAAQVIAAQPGVAAEGEPMHSINMSVLDLEDAVQTWAGERYGFRDGFWKATVKAPDEHEFVVAWELEDVPAGQEDDEEDEVDHGNDDLDLWERLDQAREDAERELINAVMVEDGSRDASSLERQLQMENTRKNAVLALRDARRALFEFHERTAPDEDDETKGAGRP